MSKIYKILITLILCFHAQMLLADTYTGWTKLKSLTLGSQGYLYIYTEATEINPAGCSSSGYYAVMRDHSAFNRIYAMLLSIYLNNLDVRVVVDGDDCAYGRYPIGKLFNMRN